MNHKKVMKQVQKYRAHLREQEIAAKNKCMVARSANSSNYSSNYEDSTLRKLRKSVIQGHFVHQV